LALAFSAIAGCGKDPNVHTSNPQLKGIDKLLAAALPPGTSTARVINFIHTRGYQQLESVEPHTLVVIVNHINPETVQPEAARVTFHFDANDKLTTYDLDPTVVVPVH
jgi:hypothetical protein